MVRIKTMAIATLLTVSPASAQLFPGPEASAGHQISVQDTGAIRARAMEYLARCLEDWERATHMTRKEWDVTCRRVAAEREKFLLQKPF
jgi:hypothetical protein